MKKIALICALDRELKPIKRCYEKVLEKLDYQVDFFLSGYGRSQAVSTFSQIIAGDTKYHAVINVGTCGIKLMPQDVASFQEPYVFEPTVFIDGDFTLENEKRELQLHHQTTEKSLPLVTVSDFGRYDKYMQESYIEDMEGFEIVNIAQRLNIPCQLIKVVSNVITENPEEDMAEFQKNCCNVMEENAPHILQLINVFVKKI